jgi:hypothetical protein
MQAEAVVVERIIKHRISYLTLLFFKTRAINAISFDPGYISTYLIQI